MRHPLELWIGLRYTRAKRRNHFISFISLVSMLGIAVGVMALIVVLSVMNGFERELRARILGMASHATISAFEGGLQGWQDVAAMARANPEIEAVAPYVQGEAMLRMSGALSGTLIRGVLPAEESTVSVIGEHMVDGKLDELAAGEYRIVLGSEIARALGVRRGDKVDLMIPQASVTPAGVVPRFRRFTVAGTFEIGMYEYDVSLAYTTLTAAQEFAGLGDRVTGVEVKLADPFDAKNVAAAIAGRLNGAYWIRDWMDMNRNLFAALQLEKLALFVIVTIIVLVAAFAIIGHLVLLVAEKRKEIGILKAMGAGAGTGGAYPRPIGAMRPPRRRGWLTPWGSSGTGTTALAAGAS